VSRRKFWGWGFEDAGPDEDQSRGIARTLSERYQREIELAPAPRIADVALPEPRIQAPASLAPLTTQGPEARAGHTYGKAYRDVIRALRGDFAAAPDLVALPRDEADITALLDWCSSQRIAAIPYGGGSSVVGGVEGRDLDRYAGVISIDLSHLSRVLEIDRRSRAARIQAGIYGPALEDSLRRDGLTLRHFPQSFEFSTLGGWIATRAGGHYATLHTHIDDFVESIRCVTPSGVIESLRLPGSGAGPSPDRLMLGSEGTLGIVTEAWMRLQDRPRFRASASVRFEGEEGFLRGAQAVHALSQSGLYPTNCRLLDAGEALTSGAGDGKAAILILGFESADHALDAWIARGLELCRDHGGVAPDPVPTRSDDDAARQGAAGAWRKSFIGLPYVRDVLARAACIAETFETSITWDRFESFHATVRAAVEDALARICRGGTLSCRFTHVYPDGPAPYFSVIAPSRRGAELAHWDEIKAAASEAIATSGGTITHHHAVGRDHRPWYDRQRPELFGETLRVTKRHLDPAGILNPGVLIDPL